jgi:hypothetical protein
MASPNRSSAPFGVASSGQSDLSGPVKTNQTITFAPLADKTFGDPDFVVAATSSSALTVTFSPSGNCTMSGTSVHLTSPGTCTITATQAGDANYNVAPNVARSFNIASIAALTLTLSPVTVTGGTNAIGTVTLAAPAPAGGVIVNLASNTPGAATVPATVSIMKGKTTKTFTVTTFAVATVTPVNISASYGGTTTSLPLAVNPAALSALTLSPLNVRGGASSAAKVTLNGPAPAGGLLVTLSSSKPAVAAIPSVTVPAGSTSATVPITTFPVTATTTVNITATAGGVSKSSTLTVKK